MKIFMHIAGLLALCFFVEPAFAQESLCQVEGRKLRGNAEKCLNSDKFENRKRCVDGLQKTMPEPTWRQCEGEWEPMHREFIDKERNKFPNQKLAFADDGGNRDNHRGSGDHHARKGGDGPHHNGPSGGHHMDKNGGQSQMTPAQCKSFEPKLQREGDKCLNRRKFKARKRCFDKVEKNFPREMWDGCQPMLEGLQKKIVAKEKSKYPNQPSALAHDDRGRNDRNHKQAHNGKGHKGQHHHPHTNGGHKGDHHAHGNHNGNQPGFSDALCKREVPKVKKAGNSCLRFAKHKKRKRCFDKIGKRYPREFWDGCGRHLDPIRKEIVAREKSKYPNQASALDDGDKGGPRGDRGGRDHHAQGGDHKGHHHGGHMKKGASHNGPAPHCEKIAMKAQKRGDRCLKHQKQAKRRRCFDKVGDMVQRNGGDRCGPMMDPIKQSFLNREKQMYPRQPSSFE